MKRIIVPNAAGESLFDQLKILYVIFRGCAEDEKLLFDFSPVRWVFPLLVLPVASHIVETGSDFIPPVNPEPATYLLTVGFPAGVRSPDQVERDRTYIPICVLERSDPRRAELETAFTRMVYKVLPDTPGVREGVAYPIAELVSNIFDHSMSNKGYIFAQFYPSKRFVDLCVVDRGRGIAGSFREELGYSFSDEEAIKKAMGGLSAKPENLRGLGLRTSRNVVCSGLGGEFVLVSGSAAFYSSYASSGTVYRLPGFHWKGVVAAFRIPEPKRPLNIYDYIEG